MKGRRRNIKIDNHPFLTSNAPILSPIRRLYEPEATTPSLHEFLERQDHPSRVKTKPGPSVLVCLFVRQFILTKMGKACCHEIARP